MHTRHVGATLCNLKSLGAQQIFQEISFPSTGNGIMDATLHLPSSTASEKVVWNGRAA